MAPMHHLTNYKCWRGIYFYRDVAKVGAITLPTLTPNHTTCKGNRIGYRVNLTGNQFELFQRRYSNRIYMDQDNKIQVLNKLKRAVSSQLTSTLVANPKFKRGNILQEKSQSYLLSPLTVYRPSWVFRIPANFLLLRRAKSILFQRKMKK